MQYRNAFITFGSALFLLGCGGPETTLIGPSGTNATPDGGSNASADGSTTITSPDGGATTTDAGTPNQPDSTNPPDPMNPPDAANPPDATDPPMPRGPAELMVYSANVENLPRTSDGCPGDWKDLFAYMATQIAKPDVFLVQQLSDAQQLGELTTYMTANLGRPYAGFIAEDNPTPFNSPCGVQKEKQTNAIIYATDRMQPAGAPITWQSYKNVDGTCVLNSQSRARGIAAKFLDAVSNEYVSAAAIHWSTANGTGADPACATANARETDQQLRVNHPDATLYVFGGDTNEADSVEPATNSPYNGWYAETNGQIGGALGYIDPIWDACNNGGTLRQCLLNNWTFTYASGKQRRIDFLFTRRSTGTPSFLRAHTITFNEGDAADLALTGSDNAAIGYSDHRAVLSRISY